MLAPTRVFTCMYLMHLSVAQGHTFTATNEDQIDHNGNGSIGSITK